MNYLRDLIHRLRQGQSERAIAADLRLSRLTVRKYHARAREAGLLEPGQKDHANQDLAVVLQAAVAPPRTPSTVQPYQSVVEELLSQGVEQRTIFDRLCQQHGYTGSYSSVRRFVRHIQPPEQRVTVRVHTAPGEEAQVDFGAAGTFLDPASGKPRACSVFVMTLGYSRHQYAEIVLDQRIGTWLGLHRRAFEWFDGVPRRLVPDNLKAAVLVAALHDPVLGEAYRRQAQHYGFLISPTRPRTPEHKGKVENGVHFIKRSFLAGQEFADLRAANQALRVWVRERAGTRDHGTTHQPPLWLFETHERAQLLPLPTAPFELIETKRVKVHPDCHVVIDGSYYSVPYAHVGAELDAFIFERVVQLFAGSDLLTTHPRAARKGQWQTRLDHYPEHKAAYLEQTPVYCQELAGRIGPSTAKVVALLLADRPLDRLRSVQALLRLEETVGRSRLEAACTRALHFGAPDYRRIKNILNAARDRDPLPEPAGTIPHSEVVAYQYERAPAEFFPNEVGAC